MAVNDGMKCTAVNQCCAACATEIMHLMVAPWRISFQSVPGPLFRNQASEICSDSYRIIFKLPKGFRRSDEAGL